MRRTFILASCLALGALGCIHVQIEPATFAFGPGVGGCPLTFYHLPPKVPYHELAAAQVQAMDPYAAEAELARRACAMGANAVVLTGATLGYKGTQVTGGVFIRTEPAPGDAPGMQGQPACPAPPASAS
jgi:hypothetical protein